MDWVRRRWATRRNWRAKRVSLTRRRIRTFLATFVVYLFWYKLAKPVDVQLTVLKDQGEYAHNIKCMPDVPVFVLGLDKDASLSGAQSFWQGGCVQFVQAVNSSRIILSEMKSLGTVDAAFDMKRPETKAPGCVRPRAGRLHSFLLIIPSTCLGIHGTERDQASDSLRRGCRAYFINVSTKNAPPRRAI